MTIVRLVVRVVRVVRATDAANAGPHQLRTAQTLENLQDEVRNPASAHLSRCDPHGQELSHQSLLE